MQQTDLLTSRTKLIATAIDGRVGRIHEALYQLAAMAVALIDATPSDAAAIDDWFKREGSAAERKDSPAARHRLYALRGLGPALAALAKRFPEVVRVRYQDDSDAALVAPAPGGAAAIETDGDRHGRPGFTAADPDHDPERAARWSPPSVDPGGRGLLVCASAPVYQGDRFVGVWSMEMPLGSLLQDAVSSALLGVEECFLVSYDGHLVAHRSIEAVIGGEAGGVRRERLGVLGGEFQELDLGPLVAEGRGRMELLDKQGHPLLVFYETIPAIRWVVFLTVPKGQLTEARTRALQTALDRVRKGDLSFRFDLGGPHELDALARSYNDMAATLASEVEARQQAEEALHEQLERVRLQQEQIEALSTPVIEVGAGLLAVPLVGPIQPERLAVLLERVLSEVVRLRAHGVLLDLTGAVGIDAAASEGMVRVARAVRLLGAQCAFSGLSPAAAQTLASQAVDLQGIVSYPTLKAALSGVLGRLGHQPSAWYPGAPPPPAARAATAAGARAGRPALWRAGTGRARAGGRVRSGAGAGAFAAAGAAGGDAALGDGGGGGGGALAAVAAGAAGAAGGGGAGGGAVVGAGAGGDRAVRAGARGDARLARGAVAVHGAGAGDQLAGAQGRRAAVERGAFGGRLRGQAGGGRAAGAVVWRS